MITLTRLNGPQFALNCVLIEHAEATPDTVLTLVDGTKYVVAESVEEVIERVREFRASVIALANRVEPQPPAEPALRLIQERTDFRCPTSKMAQFHPVTMR